MAFYQPHEFESAVSVPHLTWPTKSSRIDDDARIAILDEHYQSRLPNIFFVNRVFNATATKQNIGDPIQ